MEAKTKSTLLLRYLISPPNLGCAISRRRYQVGRWVHFYVSHRHCLETCLGSDIVAHYICYENNISLAVSKLHGR